jgi:uncharacterized protein involved in exopolysaccharide biosynthesis
MYSKEEDEMNIYEVFLIIKKRVKVIISIVLVALLLTGVVSYFMKPTFQSTFTVKCPTISNSSDIAEKVLITDIAEKLISELDLLRKDKSFKEISSKLNIDEKKVMDLVSLSAKIMQNENNFVVIVMEVRNPSEINVFKNGILYYFNQNQYVSDRITLRKEDLISLSSEIQSKITDLENLKNIVLSQIKRGGSRTLGFNPIEMDSNIINLGQKLLELKTEIKLLRGFEIGAEPGMPKEPLRPKMMLYIIIAGIVSLIIGIFVALFLEWKIKK